MDNKYFSLKDSIYDITEKYPCTIGTFMSIGIENIKDENIRRTLGVGISLKQALGFKKINEDAFSQRLIEIIEGTDNSENKIKPEIKVKGLLPCPIRIPLMEELTKFLEENQLKDKVDANLKAASLGIDFIMDEVKKAETEDDLSDLYISAGFDLFFDESLMGRFRKKKVFKDITGFEKLNKDFDNEEISLRDPDGEYSMIGGVPAVFLINKEELNERNVPESYEDLLSEEYENSVSLPIGDFDLFNAILINIYKKFGDVGIKKLKKSLLRGMHPSEMVKSNIKKGTRPAVTIMPYFFTKMVKQEGPMMAVWPKDGAIISPIFMLSKESKEKQLKPIVDFFASKSTGEIMVNNGRFPSVNPEVNNLLDSNQKFMWLGWDYIKSNDIGKLIKHCEKLFNA